MSAEVFVSYSSQDHAQVSKIIERLRKAGVSVWMDEGGIDAATLWSEAIVEAINESKILIMMVSKHSTDSANVVTVTQPNDRHPVILGPLNPYFHRFEPVHLSETGLPIERH